MEERERRSLVLHGAIVILLGLAAGFPYALVLTGAMAGEERAWRMAHAEGLQNGMMMMLVAAVGGLLSLDAAKSRLCARAFTIAGYGNVVASFLGAWVGVRGLEWGPPAANMVMYALFLAAVAGVFLGVGLVAAGAAASRRA